MQREILNEYFAAYNALDEKIASFVRSIEYISKREKYSQTIKKLVCIKGIKIHTALSL